MAKRISVRKFDTEKVQGEGSYAILSSLKVDEVRKLRIQGKDPEFDAFEGGMELLAEHIVEYNWVDDEGELLPLPSEDPTVIGKLTHAEADYLADLMIGASSKN